MTDPYFVLGVTRSADDATIRAAYLAAIRDCPPERDAERFARLRTAFDAIATRRARLSYDLFNRDALTAIDLIHALAAQFVPRLPQEAALLRLLRGGQDER